jgi:hypothetical protein
MGRKDRRKLDTSKVGGGAFFFSFLVIVPTALFSVWFLITQNSGESLHYIGRFALGACGGGVLAGLLIRGHTAVFIHELKHSIVANLVGNKATNWRIRKNTGHFEYEFTEKTRGYNAFISLAPYWLPVFTLLCGAIGCAGWFGDREMIALITGLGWGADIALIARDIGPHQSDFSDLRGGFPIGLTYVAALNIIVLVLLLTLIGAGLPGLKLLGKAVWGALYSLIAPSPPLP